jgi:methylmalonyl-CoA/ethylmalonyl-CoA epimerase
MSSDGTIAASFQLGTIDQIAFVVRDMGAALPAYTALFGPFETRTITLPPDNTTDRDGRPVSARLALAIGRSGTLEIELIAVEAGAIVHGDHLRLHGEGMHHVRYPVADLAAKRREMEAAGFTTILLGGGGPSGSQFAYLEAPDRLGHTVIELIQRKAV